MTEQELLALKIGEQTVQEMTGITFLSWIATKINNVKTYDQNTQELLAVVRRPTIGRMSDETKIDLLRKMEKLNIQIP